ncbi:MAG: Mur ligase family protein [Patescibacteria group bacterium]
MKSILKNTVAKILEYEAKLVIKKYKPRIIAITGSVGKTSTKDAIFSVVEHRLVARKSEKSFNSEIGLPLTVLGLDNAWSNIFGWIRNIIRGLFIIVFPEHYPKWLILEVGADKPGDIARASAWLRPNIVVFTAFSSVPAHVEFFKSAEALFEEKANLVKALKPSGMLILNADDERVLSLQTKTKAKFITYGFTENAMFRASNVQIAYENGRPIGTTFKFEYDGNVFPVLMHDVLGVQPIYSALAALALGVYLKINIVDMIADLAKNDTPPGRMRIIPGIKGSTIIDDTYNSSPIAAHAAVEALHNIKTKGKKIAVLGDMLELGKFSTEEHKKLGMLLDKKTSLLLVVGPRAKYIVEGAQNSGMSEKNIVEFDDARLAGKYLEGVIGEGDIVLIKGSQSMRMERAVIEIMAHPEHAGNLLVRQDEEWKAKA